jgi:agarase
VFSVQEVDGKWTIVDPDGHPFYSIGMDTVTTKSGEDRNGKNAYKDTADVKYGSTDAWADAQLKRLRGWGFNTIGAFSDEALLANRGMPFTVIIGTDKAGTDFWDPVWENKTKFLIADTTKRYVDNKNLVGYFIDNEISWLVNLSALYYPDREVLVMGEYFHKPYGRAALVDFLRTRYKSPADLINDFPDAKLPGQDWSSIQWPEAHLGYKATARGKDTLVAWAAVMAERYFSVTMPALRKGDSRHLNLGTKFVAGLTSVNVLKIAAKYSDVISVDFYDAAVERPNPNQKKSTDDKKPDFMSIMPALLPLDQLVSNNSMLADWNRLTSKPVLIAEFGYRGSDSGLPNTIPPGVVTLPTQKERAQAVTNYANCAIDTSYIVGFHWFELLDEAANGRFDGENSNWGILNVHDVPYAEVGEAFAGAGHLSMHRLDADFKPAPCKPVGFQMPSPSKKD